jgi:hypothetical protein
MKKIAIALSLAGMFMVACGGGDNPTTTIAADQGGSKPFVPPAEEPLDAPQTDGGTCLDMNVASDARAAADTHQALILEAWEAGDREQTASYMKMVADDFWVVHQATQASPTAFALADAASYGYDLGAETLVRANIQYDSGNDAAGDALVAEANAAMADGDAANVELTDEVANGGTDGDIMDGAPMCEPVIDAGAFKFAPEEIELT